MNRACRELWSHSRDITCWFGKTKAAYIIPQHFANEKILGANLEVRIDLEKPCKYYVLEKEDFKTILKPIEAIPLQ